MKRFAFLGGLVAVILVVACMGASSIGPWPITGTLPTSQQGYTVAGSNSFTCTGGTTQLYLSSGGSAATSVLANQAIITVSTAAVTMYASGGTAGIALPAGTVLTTYPTNLNKLTVNGGTTAVVGVLYSN